MYFFSKKQVLVIKLIRRTYMKRMIILALISVLMMGCTNYLVYRGDFDANKARYYTVRLETEDNIQKQSIEKIEDKIENLLQLCYVLYHRMPIQRDKDHLQKINLKLVRLNNAIDTLEDMRESFHKAFKLIFSREDVIVGPLQLQSALEVQYLAGYFDYLHELRARIIYIDEFRKKCMLEVGLPEERLEGVDKELLRVEKLLHNVILTDIPEYLKNVGIAITRDPDFQFTFTHPGEPQENTTDAAQKALLASGNESLLQNVSNYYFYFSKEQEEFNKSFKLLKDSIDRFTKTLDDYQAELSKHKKEKVKAEHQIANQSKNITAIMDAMAINIKEIYEEAMTDIHNLVGADIEYVDKNLWPKLGAEEDKVAKVKNFEYYKQSVLELNDFLEKVVRMSQDSKSKEILTHVILMGKHFTEQTGIWSPGYRFLSADWQQKLSITSIESSLNNYFTELENQAVQSIRPLWRTYSETLRKSGTQASHKLDNAGYLIVAE